MALSVPFIVINLALIFYSIGVWSERISGSLKVWHTVFFWLGLVCDTWGTGLMFDMAGGMTYDIHGLSGVLAIVLMFVHAIWATIVLIKKDEAMIKNFHKFSVAVWFIWLIPYFSPMALRMIER
ncbi:MAG: HsmA family protein [Anaerolineales bacterium]|nr:HsmA family protein [Anaerolineales bacterium]